MAKIKWDATGEKIYETGVNHGVLYVKNSDGSYGTGVPWNGLTTVTESPEGAEPNDLYADNIKYATLRSAETFSGTIEAYMYPEEFNQCDGSAAVVTGVYLGQQSRKAFGFVYRSEVGSDTMPYDGDEGYKIHIVYNCTASPSEKSHETVNDSPDAQTMSWEITSLPEECGDYKPVSTITIDSTKISKANLKLVEDKLFGTDGTGSGEGTSPTLPLPEELITLIGGSTTIDNG